MLSIAMGVALIFASSLAALFVVLFSDTSQYVDILQVCNIAGESLLDCSAHAVHAGVIGCLSALALFSLLPWMWLRTRKTPSRTVGVHAFIVLGALALGIVVYSLYEQVQSPWPIYREEIFLKYAGAVSLGNFIWPLCLQFASASRSLRNRFLFFCLLIAIVVQSPFRGTIFAVAVFGVVVPCMEFLFREFAEWGWRSKKALGLSAMIVFVVIAVAVQIAIQTMKRPTDLDLHAGPADAIAEKIGQRVAIPLYQAALAATYTESARLPPVWEELLTKLRITNGTNINKFLYAETHRGEGYGETTSLYYGEAVLRTTPAPLIWSIVAPLGLITIWFLLKLRGYEAGALIGIAVWRGSLGGLISIVPALVLQLAVFVAVCEIFDNESRSDGATGAARYFRDRLRRVACSN